MKGFLAKAALALFVAAAAALPSYAAEKKQPANFRVVAINPGLGSRYRAGCHFPVAVELEVQTTPVAGTLLVETSGNNESIPIYSMPFEITPGASYRFFLYPYCQGIGDGFTLVIKDARGRVLHSEQLTMRAHDSGYLVAYVGQEGIGGLLAAEGTKERVAISTVPLQSDFLPQKASGWDAADVVIWAHPDPAGLTTAQEKALTDWVHGGGRFVIAPGDNWQACTKTFLKDLVPGRLTGVQTATELANLEALCGAKFDAGTTMSIAALSDPAGRTLVWADAKPLVVKSRAGFGETIFLAFDPTKSPFARWRGNDAFWDSVFKLKKPAVTEDPNAQQQGYYPNASGVTGMFVRALNSFPEVKPISFLFVIIFLTVYVVLIGPVDYFLLKRIKHLEWTWFTFPAVAVAATLIAFWTISSTRAARIYVNQMTVADWSADGRAERIQNVAVLLSPTNQRYNARFANPGGDLFLMEPPQDQFRVRSGFNIAATTFSMVDTPEEGPRATGLLIPVWSTRTFCGRLRTGAVSGAPFSAVFTESAGALEGTVTCMADTAVQGVKVLHRTGMYTVGDLGPSQSGTLSLKKRMKLADFYAQVRNNQESMSRSGESWQNRETSAGCMMFATLGFDSRFFPADYDDTDPRERNYYESKARYDLPPEWSLRSVIEDGHAVIVGAVPRVATPLSFDAPNTVRWERTMYRVCVPVK